MAVLPVAASYLLLGIARQSWLDCINAGSGVAPVPLAPAVLSEAQVLLHPVGLLAALPFAALALIWLTRGNRRGTLVLWALLTAVAALPLLDAKALHQCDRKGMDGGFLVLLLIPAGFLAVLIALWRSAPRPV